MLVEILIPLHNSGNNIRLVSSYGRQWKTKNISEHEHHELNPEQKDFYIPYKQNKKTV